LIILAARPSVGKTSLALDIARNASLIHETPTLIFSLEMSADQLTQRMLSATSKVDSWRIRTGNLQEDELVPIQEAMVTLSTAPIFIDDQAGNNILRMKATARRIKAEHKLGLIVVDYLQLMAPVSAKSDNMVQVVTEISRSLKQLAKELDVPVLALSQLSRAVESRGDNARPQLSDLRDSGSIEQDADVVIFIHREKDKDNGGRIPQTDLMIEKHRNGATGMVKLYFDGNKSSFLDVDNSEYGGMNKDIEAF
jgi:replicative DNA helicase